MIISLLLKVITNEHKLAIKGHNKFLTRRFLTLFFGHVPSKENANKSKFFIQSFFYPPTDAQLNCLKNTFEIYIKIYIKTAPTCFVAITIISDRIIRAC
jgi:hypothetical protein